MQGWIPRTTLTRKESCKNSKLATITHSMQLGGGIFEGTVNQVICFVCFYAIFPRLQCRSQLGLMPAQCKVLRYFVCKQNASLLEFKLDTVLSSNFQASNCKRLEQEVSYFSKLDKSVQQCTGNRNSLSLSKCKFVAPRFNILQIEQIRESQTNVGKM